MPAIDDFAGSVMGAAGPFEHIEDITPNDSNDLAFVTRALWIGGAGSVRVTTLGGETATLAGAGAGQIIPGRFTRVWATGTTATAIEGLR